MKEFYLQFVAIALLFFCCSSATAQGQLWGMTENGGPDGQGVLFGANYDGTSLAVKYTFPSSFQGASPGRTKLTLASNGKFYGVTPFGGVNNEGVLYEFDPGTNSYTRKIDFTSLTNGANPEFALILAGNNKLYGVAQKGGTYNAGTLFEYDPATNALAVVKHFNPAVQQGNSPVGKLLLASNGKLYGTTYYGGTNDNGILFEHTPGGVFTIKIYSLGSQYQHPQGGLIQASDGFIYGMLQSQPSGIAIYKYEIAANFLTNKLTVAGTYCDGLTEVNGKLFGNAQQGGPSYYGFIFEYTLATSTAVRRYDFSYSPGAGLTPSGMLELASNGKLYGITSIGGVNDQGTLFEFNPLTYEFQSKLNFDLLNGKSPMGGMVLAPNGKLYGTTSMGGLNNRGIIYDYDYTTNTLSKKVDFSYAPNGSNAVGSLVQGANRQLYGMTTEGGVYGKGVLFQFDPVNNTYTKRVDFDGANNGSLPMGGLLAAGNGNLYGITYNGGVDNLGVLFEYNTTTNTLTKLYDFMQSTGAYPKGTLVQAADGKLYGVTSNGGSWNSGVLFDYDLNGNVYTKRFEFSSGTSIGVIPSGSLLAASNGKLYGSTSAGGPSGYGILFEYDPITSTYSGLPNTCSTSGSWTEASNHKLYSFNNPFGFGNLIEYDPATNACSVKAAMSGNSANSVSSADFSLTPSTNGKLYGVSNGNVLFEYNVATNSYSNRSAFGGLSGSIPHGTLLLTITPTVQGSSIAFAPVYSTQLQINVSPGNGMKRLVVIKQGGAVDFLPSDNVSYNLGDVIGGNRIVKTDAGASAYVTGLLTSTTYYSKVFEYNELGARKQYLINNAPVGSVTTLPPPDVPVITPANAAINQNVTLNVTAKTLTGATTYTLELNTLPDFTGTSFIRSGAKTQSFSGLSYYTTYYTRVKTNLSPDYSIVTSFTTAHPEYFSYITNPGNNAINVNDNLTVTSNTTIGATVYTIELNTAADFTATSIVKTGALSQVFNNLAVATTYYNRVMTDLSPAWGVTRSFTTGDAPTLSYVTSPANNAVNQLWSLNLISNAVTGATTYTIQLSPVSDFSSGVVQNSSSTTSVPISGLSYNTQYFVRVSTNLSPGVWGSNRTFTTGYPSNFSYIMSPVNNAVNVSRLVNLSSALVKDATLYTIEANTAADFTGTSVINSSASNVISFALDYSTQYYVRVKTNLVPEWGPARTFTTTTAISNTYVVTPANNAVNQLTTLNITSADIYGANQYTIQLSSASDFSSNIIELSGPTKTISFPQLNYNTTYYSRVSTDRSPGLWGAIRNFKTIDQYMTAPANGATNINWITNISVNAIAGTTLYTIEANTLADFTGTSIVKSGASNTQSFTLAYNQTYYVRAKSNLANGWGSLIRSFTTGSPLSFAYVTSPVDGATGVASTVSITANTVTGATNYTIELNTTSDFTGTSIVKNSASRTISFPGLTLNTTYYNRVQTNLAPGQWGATRSFNTVNSGGRIRSDEAIEANNVETTDTPFAIELLRNPFGEQLSFIVKGKSSLSDDLEFKVIDMKGSIVYSGHTAFNKREDIQNAFSKGMYILKVTSAEGTRNERALRVE